MIGHNTLQCPAVAWMNLGLMLIRPDLKTHKAIVDMAAKGGYDCDTGAQDMVRS